MATGPGGRTDAFGFSQQVGQVGGAGHGDVGEAGAFWPRVAHVEQQLWGFVFGFAAGALAHRRGQHHAGGSVRTRPVSTTADRVTNNPITT